TEAEVDHRGQCLGDPKRLEPILADFDPEPGGRHPSMFSYLCWAAREAKAGCFAAQRAIDTLTEMWAEAVGGTYRGTDADELNRMVHDALFAADNDGTPEEL